MDYVVQLAKGTRNIGNKGENLTYLMRRRGLKVPDTLVVRWDAFEDAAKGEGAVVQRLRDELKDRLDPNQGYAVRSSANLEDSKERSFAGRFLTLLNVKGSEEVSQAVQRVWDSALSPQVTTYLDGQVPSGPLKMAVLIQRMVPQIISGVSFSRNPLTGAEEVIVEAVDGSGERLVQDGQTPDRWVVRGELVVRSGAGSAMTEDLAGQIAKTTRALDANRGGAVDLEWVYDGKDLYWVQLRDITALRHLNIYSNSFSKEFLPGAIKPLVWSINTPLVNGAWASLFEKLTGMKDLDPETFSKQFYYQAYFNMSVVGRVWQRMGLPRDSLERLMVVGGPRSEKGGFRPTPQMMALLPRVSLFALDLVRLPWELDRLLKKTPPLLKRFQEMDPRNMEPAQILIEMDRLFAIDQELAYYNILAYLEQALSSRLLRSRLGKFGYRLEDVRLFPQGEGATLYPGQALSELGQTFRDLPDGVRVQVEAASFIDLDLIPEAAGFKRGLDDFLARFGHLSDSGNDFSVRPWRETPDAILHTVTGLEASSPGAGGRDFADLRIPPGRRSLTRMIYDLSSKSTMYRERVGSLYTYGYGLFRPFLLALGEHLVRRGVLKGPEEIFHLYMPEVRQIVEGGCEGNSCNDYQLRTSLRRREMEDLIDLALPPIIYGETAPPLERDVVESLDGIATSAGYYKGPARVVRGMADFSKVQSGDVLVIPYSDVGWTPLFAKAGAVVSEAGGMLSHSSIIAREYGIPAVVSVQGAMRLEDGTELLVDGFKGQVRRVGPQA